MGKNNFLIEQMKRLQNACNNVTPEVYAAFALTLHRKYGWRYKRISKLFAETQEMWNECIQNTDVNMIEMCKEETGIDVKGKVE